MIWYLVPTYMSMSGLGAFSRHSSCGFRLKKMLSFPAGIYFFLPVNLGPGVLLNQSLPNNDQYFSMPFLIFKMSSSCCLLHEVQIQKRMNVIQIMPHWGKEESESTPPTLHEINYLSTPFIRCHLN